MYFVAEYVKIAWKYDILGGVCRFRPKNEQWGKKMSERLCMNCFSKYHPDMGTGQCLNCGWDNGKPQPHGALPYETEIASRYVVGRVRAANGEGFTYCALDRTTQKVVALREFFPRAIAGRDELGAVVPSPDHARTFRQYSQDFLELSKSVSRLREVTVVESVLDIVEENGTVYTVYADEGTVSLRRYVRDSGGRLTWNETSRLFTPVITALSLINSLGVSHLALSPETLRVDREGNMVITGFHINAVHRAGSLLDLELHPGCAAIEQYSAKAACGEVSDVYALGACMLFCISGQLPGEATKRLHDQRLMISKDALKTVPPFAVTAIANALQIKQADRTGSFETFRTELNSAPALVDEVEETDAIRRLPPVSRDLPRRRFYMPPVMWLIVSCAATLIVLFVIASSWLGDQGMSFGDLGEIFDSSAAETPVDVPDMVGQSYTQWENRTKSGEFNFKLNVKSKEYNDTVEEGYIIDQTPEKGETVEPGGTVSVTVSQGKAIRPLPEYEGLSFAELQGRLRDEGFAPAKEDVYSTEVELGYVIGYKDHEPGDEVDYGETITVIVSAGPEVE